GARGGFTVGDPYYALVTYPSSTQWAEWALPAKKRTPAETRLLDAVRQAGGRIATSSLAKLLPGLDEALIDEARAHLVERLILFHGISAETYDLELGFLATERRRCGGVDARRLAPVEGEPRERFLAPLLARDAVAILLELA